MRRLYFASSIIAVAAATLTACGPTGSSGGGARSEIWAAGSSTVFPFATRVAENWARKTDSTAPKVESLGTGGGIQLFCGGAGLGFPDIANASRPMKASEFDSCVENGVTDIVEIKIGYDGIVMLTALDGEDFDLSQEEIYRALAAELPVDGAFADNPNERWSDVADHLPNIPILVYGPPTTSGTRDAFGELAMEKGAEAVPEVAALEETDEERFDQVSTTIRNDAWQDSGENDNAVIGTLTRTPGSMGVVGYSFLDNNRDEVKAASINGVAPVMETIASGEYPLSRSMYIYVKSSNVELVPGLSDFINEFVSDASAGSDGYLLERGLIPLPAEEHEEMKARAADMPAMERPAG